MVIFNTYVSLPEGIRQNLDPHGGFPKYGYPQIIHFNRIFHYKPSSYWGTPILGSLHIETKTNIDQVGHRWSWTRTEDDIHAMPCFPQSPAQYQILGRIACTLRCHQTWLENRSCRQMIENILKTSIHIQCIYIYTHTNYIYRVDFQFPWLITKW